MLQTNREVQIEKVRRRDKLEKLRRDADDTTVRSMKRDEAMRNAMRGMFRFGTKVHNDKIKHYLSDLVSHMIRVFGDSTWCGTSR